jgi:hypothetical protein
MLFRPSPSESRKQSDWRRKINDDDKNADRRIDSSRTYRARAIRPHAEGLVRSAPDIIYANPATTVQALQRLTSSIPIVFSQNSDPVQAGAVQSLARPGGNMTGFLGFQPSMNSKFLQLLKDIAPQMTRVAVMQTAATQAARAREINDATLSWLWPALQYFHDRRYRYDPRNEQSDPTFWIGTQEVLIVAQHHQLRTPYLDWTFDPRVALAFAASGLKVGEQGIVSVRAAFNSWAVLPPNFLKRLWQQSGFLEQTTCDCQLRDPFSSPCGKRFDEVAKFHSITFSVADDAEKSFLGCFHKKLMDDRAFPQVGRLLEWSKQQAMSSGPAKLNGARTGSLPDLLRIWDDNGLDPATIPIGDDVVPEDVDAVWNMFEKRSLRMRDGVVCWDLRLLSKAIMSVSMDCTAVCMKKEAIEALDPIRKQAVKMAAAGADHLATIAKYGGQKFMPYFV